MDEREAIKALKLEGGLEITGNPRRVAEFFEALSIAEQALQMKSAYDQVRWERDIAIEQLAEIGLSFGEKTDSVREALEKQISKKVIDNTPVENPKEDSWYQCPCCKGDMTKLRGFFCYYCGQKLEWD